MGYYKCKNCMYLDEGNYNRITGKYFCKERRYYVVWDSGSCSSFKLAPHKKNLYITTKAMELVNVPCENNTYMAIRDLRDILEEDKEYAGLLYLYDRVAPAIAKKMGEDEYGVENAMISIEKFIEPCAELVKQGEIEESVALYKQMVVELMQVYGVSLVNPNKEYENEFEQYDTNANFVGELVDDSTKTNDVVDLPMRRLRTKQEY